MKKIKIGASIILLLCLCLICQKIVLLFNYMLALFLHEMAHLIVASKRGYNLKQFKLDMFGMSIELDEEISSKDCFAINIAGPMLNLGLCVLCMAMYWIFPLSYIYLNVFCFANLALALFNLLPLYPLDGGKIFKGMISNDKLYYRLDVAFRIVFSLVFFVLFIISIFDAINYFYLLMAVFFATSFQRRIPTFSIFKHTRDKHFQKVVIVKVSIEDNLYSLIKLIKRKYYTIFYCNQIDGLYLDEDKIIYLATKYPLKTSLRELN